MGHATPKYFALRELLASYLPPKQKLTAIPEPFPVVEISEIHFTQSASVWDNLSEVKQSPQPKPMEMFDQKAGFILYRTKLIGLCFWA